MGASSGETGPSFTGSSISVVTVFSKLILDLMDVDQPTK
jgi:hypothetical protein